MPQQTTAPVRPISSPATGRRWLRLLSRCVLAVVLLFCVLLIALRFLLLPNINIFRPQIERYISSALGQSVTIGHIDTSWEGIQPLLTLSEANIKDQAGRPALSLTKVQALVAWQMLFRGRIHLHQLELNQPKLAIRRLDDGTLLIAGIPLVASDNDDNQLVRWILAQDKMLINGATVTWSDDLRQAPPLVLEEVNFSLNNDKNGHHLALDARPPAHLASQIKIDGDLRGSDPSRFADWTGKLKIDLDYTDLAGWHPWIDYPAQLSTGQGSLSLTVDIGTAVIRQASADFSLSHVTLQLAHDLAPLELDQCSGTLRLGQTRIDASHGEISGEGIMLALGDGTRTKPARFALRWKPASSGKIEAEFNIDTLDIGIVAALAERLPLDVQTRDLLSRHQPRGQVHLLDLVFTGNRDGINTFSLKTAFSALELTAQNHFPGFSGLSGSLEANESKGHISFDSQNMSIDLPEVFPEPRLDFDTFRAMIEWTKEAEQIDVNLQHAVFNNADATGEIKGFYQYTGAGPGMIDITGSLSRAEGNRIWRYMPQSVNRDAREWLKRSIRSGIAVDTRLILKGDLAKFPFPDNQGGYFLVTTQAQKMDLDYAPRWPGIKGLDADLRFEGKGMTIEGRGGTILKTRIKAVKAAIPDFIAHDEWLHLQGTIEGTTQEFLKFIEASPVGGKINHFTRHMRAQGNGNLDLEFDMPLRKVVDTAIKGLYNLNNNQLIFDDDNPPLTALTGAIGFTENDVTAQGIRGAFLGLPLALSFKNQKHDIIITATGNTSIDQFAQAFPSPYWRHFSGSTDWQADIGITQQGTQLTLLSELKGIAVDLPEPLTKDAEEPMAFRFTQIYPSRKNVKTNPEQESTLEIGDIVRARLIEQQQKILRGAIGIGSRTTPALPAKDLRFVVSLPQLNLDDWRAFLPVETTQDTVSVADWPPFVDIGIRTDHLNLFSRGFHKVTLTAQQTADGWQANFDSQETKGSMQWENHGQGRLHLRFSRLTLPDNNDANGNGTFETSALKSLPALDIIADQFSLGNRSLGRLEIQAINRNTRWQIDHLSMVHPSGRIEATGEWHNAAGNDPGSEKSSVDVRVDIEDAGQYLTALGFPGAVQNGKTLIAGQLSWPGKPTQFASSILSGQFQIDAERGQFAKIDPGVGKLLGLLSLQSLSRRISFDFHDVFSDGFAFDSIKGKVVVNNGIMSSDEFEIVGPAARVRIQGDIDLKNETQALGIIVEPDLGSTVGVGTMVISPVTGIAAIIAFKLLQNPLDRVFASAYAVTGSWSDPKLEKLARSEPVPTASQSTGPNDTTILSYTEKPLEPQPNHNPYLP